jgi:hypothetical protein
MPLKWEEVPDCDPAEFTLLTAPKRRDASDGIDEAAGSLDKLLELAAGQPDAPWPPHDRKQKGEPPRVAPSKQKQPLITVAKARYKEDALEGLERWKKRHRAAAKYLEVDDVLVDSMRGRSSTWTRIRVNLRHVPPSKRPNEEAPDPDYDPWKR